MGDENESFERATADLEMLSAAFPDEVTTNFTTSSSTTFPISFTIHLTEHAYITLELIHGYPTDTGIQVSLYRSSKPKDKHRMEKTVSAIRRTAQECQEDGIEGGFSCCSTALEVWNSDKNHDNTTTFDDDATIEESCCCARPKTKQHTKHHEWFTGNPLVDRKSTFQAHLCNVNSEQEVDEALSQLIDGSTKIQRATHNMYAWRVTETNVKTNNTILKHDNDDDGEDAAGSKLAYLLDMRKDDNVLVVVSRWYGGIHLGPKRFGHIINVARELLVECRGERSSK